MKKLLITPCAQVKCTCFFLLFFTLPGLARSQTVIGVRDELSAQVDRIFSAYDRTDSPGCAVGIFRDGRIVYARGYGMANLELGVSITPRTVFNTGSVTKTITMSAVLLLVKDGKVSLDDPISRFFPEMAPFARTITVRHLLTHRSGLHEYYQLMRLAGISSNLGSTKEYVRMLTRSTSTNFPPGTRQEYSNSGYVMAGEIVSRVSGQSVSIFLKERVFDPLGMADTRMFDNESTLIPRRAQGYDARPGVPVRTSHSDVNQSGDGGIWTSIEDFARWDGGSVGGQGLGESLFALTPNTFRGLRAVMKDGNDLGYTATYNRFLDQKLSVATLCNLDANTDPLTRQVAAVYLKSHLEPEASTVPDAWGTALLAEPKVPIPVEELRRLESWWASEQTGEMNFTRIVDGRLRVNEPGVLESLGGDRFRAPGPGTVELVFDGAGPKGPRRLHIRNRNGARTLERRDFVQLTEKELAEYAGAYRSDEIETTYTLSADSTGLVVRVGNRWLGRLEPTWQDGFLLGTAAGPLSVLPNIPRSNPGDKRFAFEFSRDARGRIAGFVIQGRERSGVRNLPFIRRPY